MAARFGRDFAGVRVHTGPEAARSARELGALAYTIGSDIVADAAIDSPDQHLLLAHELAHVVQRAESPAHPPTVVQRQTRRPSSGGTSGAGTPPPPVATGSPPPPPPVFKCGPEVRTQLSDVVARTRAAYAGWTANQKDEACWALENSACGPDAWDIVELHNSNWIPTIYQPRGCATTGAPAGHECGQSVQIGTGCHHHGSVNYVIFGVMCDLCGMWERTMRTLIWLYKHSSANYEASRDWAVAGYNGWPGVADPSGDRSNCRADGCPYIGHSGGTAFRLHWYPSAYTETVSGQCTSALDFHRDLRDNGPDYSGMVFGP